MNRSSSTLRSVAWCWENFRKRRQRCSWVSWTLLGFLSGCQSGITGLPGLGNLNQPTRVPPPAAGSFQTPSSYTNQVKGSVSSNVQPATTLSQLRELESAPSQGKKNEADYVVSASVGDGSYPSRPVVAAPLTTSQALSSGFDRGHEVATAAFDTSSGTAPTVIPASATMPTMKSSSQPVSANIADVPSSSDAIKWRSSSN